MSGRSPRIISIKGTKLGTWFEGSLVKLNENGVPIEFYVAKHDYEPELNGSGRTLLVRKDCYAKSVFGTNTAYAGNTLDSLLNNTYLQLLEQRIQTLIGTTTFYYTVGNGDSTLTTLSRAVFALSISELGRNTNNANVEGSELPNYETLRKSDNSHWTRTPMKTSASTAYYFTAAGTRSSDTVNTNDYARPAFTLPADIMVLEDGTIA